MRRHQAHGASNKFRAYIDMGNPDLLTDNDVFKINTKQTMAWLFNKNDSSLSIYQNAIRQQRFTNSKISTYAQEWSNAWIGRDARTGGTALNGKIYSVRIYNRVLTENEIAQNYKIDKNRYNITNYVTRGLTIYYDAINNTGTGHSNTATTWKDLSGNENNATITGSIEWLDKALNIKAGKTAKILQDTTFSNMQSFTLQVCGSFSKTIDSATPTYPRIIGTNDNYTSTYEAINGLDLTVSENSTVIYSPCSNGDANNAYKTYFGSSGKQSCYTVVWDYTTKKLTYYVNAIKEKEVTIANFDNINFTKLCMGHGRNSVSGRFYYNSVMIYNIPLTQDEVKQNYGNYAERY